MIIKSSDYDFTQNNEPRTMSDAAKTCMRLGISPMIGRENKTIHARVNPEKGARVLLGDALYKSGQNLVYFLFLFNIVVVVRNELKRTECFAAKIRFLDVAA